MLIAIQTCPFIFPDFDLGRVHGTFSECGKVSTAHNAGCNGVDSTIRMVEGKVESEAANITTPCHIPIIEAKPLLTLALAVCH
jgi:hypothetical protein